MTPLSPPHSCIVLAPPLSANEGNVYRDPPTYVVVTAEDGGKILAQKQVIWGIKQGSDGNWTELGRPEVTDIYYNTVAHF